MSAWNDRGLGGGVVVIKAALNRRMPNMRPMVRFAAMMSKSWVLALLFLLLLSPGCPNDSRDGGKKNADASSAFGTGDSTDTTGVGEDVGTDTTDTTGTTDTGGTDTSGDTGDTGGTGDTGTSGTDTGDSGTDGGPPQICEPGKTICHGVSGTKICNDSGTAFSDPVSCPDKEYCDDGKCGASCAIDPKLGSYVGCVFWSVDLPNYPDFTLNPTPEDLPHALVISNPAELDATVTYEMPEGWGALPETTVPGNQSVVVEMPVMNVPGTGVTKLGIRLKSSRPVLVHQFNPWDNNFSNDASLLLPEPLLGDDYVVLTWPTSPLGLVEIPGFPTPPNQAGYFTVVAPYDDTQVSFQVSAPIKAGDGVAELPAGGVQTVTLHKGEVLNLEAEPSGLFDKMDLSGSRVWADKPIAVFSGHEEAVVDEGCCADHLEEQLLPINILDTHYLAVKAKPRGTEPDYWRIQAAEVNVTITTDPPQPGADNVVLSQKGEWVEVITSDSFEIKADGKIQVAQYLVSQEATEDFIGDPSQILAVPVPRFRDYYALMVPPNYNTNWVTIVRTPGTPITVDGAPVSAAWKTFAAAGWEYAYVKLEPGIHAVEGDAPFSLSAYGYNNAVSYGYPGGMTIVGE